MVVAAAVVAAAASGLALERRAGERWRNPPNKANLRAARGASNGCYRLISSAARTSGRSESWIGPENGVLISRIR
ncbi:MAG: hypothetical protein C207_00504 [Bradyrhizobium sp. DFCI-1]|nr:MAG: hypothetical protein C207_00504 [Bradyrhizobium sp. DFCI-1]